MEYLDVLDKNAEKTGRVVKRGTKLSSDEYTMAAAIVIRNGDNFIITQRAPKKMGGLKWEFPGGGVQAGESSKEAAKRELEEETGLEVPLEGFHFLGRLLMDPYRIFMDVYEVHVQVELSQLCLQKEETVDAKCISKEELKENLLYMTQMDRIIYEKYIGKMA